MNTIIFYNAILSSSICWKFSDILEECSTPSSKQKGKPCGRTQVKKMGHGSTFMPKGDG